VIRAVVFDLWNTLVRSQQGSPFRRIQRLIRPDQARHLDDFMWDSMLRPYPDCASFLAAWREALDLDEAQVASVHRVFAEAASDAEPFPETLEVLDRTQVLARTALLSNTQSFDMELLTALGLADRLRTRILSAEIGALKPHPPAFAAVQERLGLFPGEIAMVGDSWKDDVTGALDAGWTAIWVNREGAPMPEVDSEAEVIEVRDLRPVPDIIRRLQAGARCSTCLG
jgi:HAD superfamily hydrolase (TIGR01493 family)